MTYFKCEYCGWPVKTIAHGVSLEELDEIELELYRTLYLLKERRHQLEKPPDLGIHVTDGVKPKMTRGE